MTRSKSRGLLGTLEAYGGLRILWPLIPICILSVYMFGHLSHFQSSSAQASATYESFSVYVSKDLEENTAAQVLGTEGRVASSLLGPYYAGNLSTVRRRWLLPFRSATLKSPKVLQNVAPNPVELYGSLAGGKEDPAKIQRHQLAWKELLKNVKGGKSPKIAIATTTYDNLETIRNWIGYHMSMGVGTFYLFLDGRLATKDAVQRLNRWIPKDRVKLIPRTLELRDEQGESRIWKENWLGPFFHKPCNSDLFVKQNLNLEMAVKYALKDKMDWLLHIDTDELLHPGAQYNYSMQDLLAAVPSKWQYIEFANYEGLPESDSVRDPFAGVTLFKKSHLHLPGSVYTHAQNLVRSKNGASYTMAYSNGKSAARVRPGLRPNGAHKFSNYNFPLDKARMGKEYWVPHPTAYIAHYVYSKYSDLESRRDRCDCLPDQEDAPRCFMLSFDREAFIASSTLDSKALKKWYHERVVWSDEEVLKGPLIQENVLVREHFFANRTQQVEAIFKQHS